MKTWMIAAAVLFAFPFSARADAKTARMWKAKCATCHGADGKGATDEGARMGIQDYTSAAWQKSITDAQMKSAITGGVNRVKGGKTQVMDPFTLEPAQVDALVAYVRALK
jgi:mono/diheme cytochrome c family protein